ncbi:hypothetical protein N7481_011173 [Penicillium waksmanii]|uniref:uncharacterized protein n=1 Tax=Penicillium waksmanii TaxID=69791 RepID=UPI0025468C80|nr:uncharacterized protein N7481_011173 [Penicillium waksmanii]KAJ5973963.1 hypothetical protein N7481_011173 [Penicillium waksmanii]
MGQVMLEKGADSKAADADGVTPLVVAAFYGNLEFVEWLLRMGASIEPTNGDKSALQMASLGGHDAIVKILPAAGADANAQGGDYFLLDSGVSINAQGGEYGNALPAALLINFGADINTQGGKYGNALLAAVLEKNTEAVVHLLLNSGADINAQEGEYGNALQAAATRGENIEVIQLLLNSGAEINAQGGEYGSALDAAIKHEHTEVVELLQRWC